ncbi:hypothetical protein NAI58_12525, partial [Francisella tularensis subsp. holarctica]
LIVSSKQRTSDSLLCLLTKVFIYYQNSKLVKYGLLKNLFILSCDTSLSNMSDNFVAVAY